MDTYLTNMLYALMILFHNTSCRDDHTAGLWPIALHIRLLKGRSNVKHWA
jgi:hypothetical protein